MEKEINQIFAVSDFVDILNQTLEYSFSTVCVEGEVSSFKVSQGKWVFFDIKDDTASVNCFMSLYNLRVPIRDGMKVVVKAYPKLTARGKFSLTVNTVKPSGEGNIKKSFEILKAKLEKEGLFAVERKRRLPEIPSYIAVISSVNAAGYADFIKIVNQRWGGLRIDVADVQVQGDAAPDQIIRALKYINSQEELPEMIVIIRGGGSADDLSVFNDELLVREIASSRIPTVVGVGHEVDVTLADMVADVRASTPTNAAEIITPDKREISSILTQLMIRVINRMDVFLNDIKISCNKNLDSIHDMIDLRLNMFAQQVDSCRQVLVAYNPMSILYRGYAIVRGELKIGNSIKIEKSDKLITAEVTDVKKR